MIQAKNWKKLEKRCDVPVRERNYDPIFLYTRIQSPGGTRCDDDIIQFEDGGLLLGGFRTGTNR